MPPRRTKSLDKGSASTCSAGNSNVHQSANFVFNHLPLRSVETSVTKKPHTTGNNIAYVMLPHDLNHHAEQQATTSAVISNGKAKRRSESDTNSERVLMRQWIEQRANEGNLRGLQWYNQAENTVKISWKHGSKSGWSVEDCEVFVEWAKYTGRYDESGEFKRWKANFRCALHSLPDVEEVEMEKGATNESFKIFKLLKEQPRKRSKKTSESSSRTRSCSGSTSRSERLSTDVSPLPSPVQTIVATPCQPTFYVQVAQAAPTMNRISVFPTPIPSQIGSNHPASVNDIQNIATSPNALLGNIPCCVMDMAMSDSDGETDDCPELDPPVSQRSHENEENNPGHLMTLPTPLTMIDPSDDADDCSSTEARSLAPMAPMAPIYISMENCGNQT